MVKENLKIANLDVKTRIVMPPMATSKSKDGIIGDDMLAYYKERAANPNIGMIITEHSFISPEGMAAPNQVSIARDEDIAEHSKIVKVIHEEGKVVFAQINHAGNAAKNPYEHLDVDTMSKDDIKRIRNLFVDAAVRAKKAGYDGVEVHSAHGYLLNQFYSPLRNHRTDEYSAANIENRVRLHKEILEEIRNRLGDYPLALRLGGCDYEAGGSTEEDAVNAAKILAGYLDMIDISGGVNNYIRKDNNTPGWFSDMSAAVKKEVNIPVLVTGGITEIEDAEKILTEGKADLIGVGRALMRNANWPNK